MPIPASISDLSTTPGSNSPSGSDSPAVLDDHQRTAYAFIRTLSDAKAAIADTVLLTGNQTIAGTKTFSSPIAGSVTGSAANVTGTVAIANGGTGQTTAAAAFNALKQAATEAASGVVELSTTSEAQIGTDNGTALTPLRFRDALNATGSAPTYAGRTWIKLNGTGTPALQAGGNIASITDNGVGRYTLNFGTALPDANYAVVGSTDAATNTRGVFSVGTQATTSCGIATNDGNTGAAYDAAGIFVVIVR